MSSRTMSQQEIEAVAQEMMCALDERRQIPLLTQSIPDFDLGTAYRVASAVCQKRKSRGEKPIGRKLGFTNSNIWPEYEVYAPIWGYVYDTTVSYVNPANHVFDLRSVVEPRIEPEITLCFEKKPEAGMNEVEILECVRWVAHGYEVVQSLFSGWKFAAPDTVAAFGLHGALMLGPQFEVTKANFQEWLRILQIFEIALYRDGVLADTGAASNVLGGPLSALRNFLAVIAKDAFNSPLQPGEIVTTGTVTRAFPIGPGATWTTRFVNAPFPGMSLLPR